MSTNVWLPSGQKMPDGSTLRRVVAEEENWQIVSTGADRFALIVLPELHDRWIQTGLIDRNLFERVIVSDRSFHVFCGETGRFISSVRCGPYTIKVDTALVFAAALREAREKDVSSSLKDAVFLEQAALLLPTYSEIDTGDDQVALGMWLSGGVYISTASFDKICDLLRWMPSELVSAIIREAGLPVAGGRHWTDSHTQPEELAAAQKNAPVAQETLDRNARFSLPGRQELERFFNEQIVDIIANEDKYRRMGIEFPTAVVLYGPPGCGKTFAAEKLVEFLGWPSYSIDSGSIGSPYIHATSKKIAEVFEEAIAHAPSVIMIDEMEAFLANRNFGAVSGTHHMEEVAEFLRRIPEAAKHHVLLIAMTNMIDSIDPAIIRRGRFDHIIEVKMPSVAEVHALLGSLLSNLPVSEDIEIERLSEQLAGHPLSDAAFVVKEAGRLAVKADKDTIDNEALFMALDALPPQK